jgi:hypothetical protein
VHFGVERPRRGGIPKGRDGFRVAALSPERDPQVERRIRIITAVLEHDPKRALGLGELVVLQMRPTVSEARVNGRRTRPSIGLAIDAAVPRQD